MKKAVIALVAVLISSVAVAQTRIVSIDAYDLSYSGGLSFAKDKKASGSNDRDTSNFRLNVRPHQEKGGLQDEANNTQEAGLPPLELQSTLPMEPQGVLQPFHCGTSRGTGGQHSPNQGGHTHPILDYH